MTRPCTARTARPLLLQRQTQLLVLASRQPPQPPWREWHRGAEGAGERTGNSWADVNASRLRLQAAGCRIVLQARFCGALRGPILRIVSRQSHSCTSGKIISASLAIHCGVSNSPHHMALYCPVLEQQRYEGPVCAAISASHGKPTSEGQAPCGSPHAASTCVASCTLSYISFPSRNLCLLCVHPSQ